MALFRLFSARQNENDEMIPELTENIQSDSNGETAPSEEEKKDEKRMITITWGTGFPIDIIFNFIHKNFEEDGFQDALVNCELTYRDAKKKIIRNDLEMLFKRITLRYKKDIRDVDVKIDIAREAYALTTVNKLLAQRETYEEHLSEINEMQTLLNNNDPKMLTMIESYQRGFLKGIAAVTTNFIENR